MPKITLKCWSCGKIQDAEVNRYPEFAFEVAKMATDSGWHGWMDMRYSRSLVFCSENCVKKQQTKDGGFRKYPKKVVYKACV